MLRGLRTCERNEAETGAKAPEEYVSHSWSSSGQWRMNARLDPENGAVVQSAIETIARGEGLMQAQALTRMAEIALAAINDSERPVRAGGRGRTEPAAFT